MAKSQGSWGAASPQRSLARVHSLKRSWRPEGSGLRSHCLLLRSLQDCPGLLQKQCPTKIYTTGSGSSGPPWWPGQLSRAGAPLTWETGYPGIPLRG